MKQVAEGIKGEGNHILPIYSSKDGNKTAALLYCLDTNAYSKIKTVKGYDWIGRSQIDWYSAKAGSTQNGMRDNHYLH